MKKNKPAASIAYTSFPFSTVYFLLHLMIIS